MTVPPEPSGPRAWRRAPIRADAAVSLDAGSDPSDPRLPVVITAQDPGVELPRWVAGNTGMIEEHLTSTGALLFRGFRVGTAEVFERVISTLYGDLVIEHERSSPRHAITPNVYSSTDHPADQEIFVHNEMSYSARWPMRVAFCCLAEPMAGGQTPLAAGRCVLRAIDGGVLAEFERRGVLYVRNYGSGFGLPWQLSFGTDQRAEVERYCERSAMTAEWGPGDRLQTRRVAPAFATHPATGERLWFNHATFFHISTLPELLRRTMLADLGAEGMPAASYYGDGTLIDDDTAAQLRAAYRSAQVSFDWNRGDVLIIDNMLVAHGRASYTGPRSVAVAMAELASRS